MKILYVITGLGVGGAERVVVDLADGMVNEGHSPVIVYLNGDVMVRPLNLSIPLICLHLDGVLALPGAFRRFRRVIKEHQPDVVHSHMVHANIFSRLARVFVHMKRLISTAHNTNEESRVRMWAYRTTNWLADVLTNVSSEAVAAFERDGAVQPGQMLVVYNGIDVGRFKKSISARMRIRSLFGLAEEKTLFLAVGRLEPQKDFGNLIRALTGVMQIRADWECLISGEGSLRAELAESIETAGLSGKVRLLGLRRDVQELLSAADVFVLSSAWEGFPLVVGEAMACAVPVVATDCGGVAEFLGEQTRYLVAPRDAEALSRGILDALQTPPAVLREIGDAHRKRITEHFSSGVILNEWLALYRTEELASSKVDSSCAG